MLKFVLMLAVLAGVAWFGTTVKLGQRTLFGHLQAISGTKESQELVEGTKQSAKPLVDDVRRRIAGNPDPESRPVTTELSPDAGPPQDKITAADRQKLRRLLGNAEHTTTNR